MNKGFYLTLMMGSFNASPVPRAVIEALTDVQVSSTVGSQGGFQLKFTIGRNAPLAQLHNSGFFDPRQRVIIAVTVNGQTEVLMDGIITKQDLTPSSAAGKSTLTVTGLDLTALMDFIDLTGIPYPALPNFLIVDAILAKYAVLGVVPVAIPNAIPSFKNPLDAFVKQQGTDYRYIQKLGSSTGWIFYLDPGPNPGMSLAYWGPDLSKMFGGLQPALSINLDASTNIDSLSFSYNGTLATQYLVTVIEPHSGVPIPVPVPNIDIFKAGLGKHAPTPLKSEQGPKGEANYSLADAGLWAVGKLFASSDVVSGSGQLDVLRYGHVFKARQLAAVRGAGDYYDGKYYVKSVTHNIKRGEYKQSFTLARGGIGSSVSTVNP
ncbi:hypothetical protein FJ976_19210 [Mesorhizobium sp. B1-1-9]|uniref:hypothetical protein n=1 Tax=Mesorhizobium sp. B1-1-9 TaxID=2589975 RepID=UPI00112B9C5E|nr:hypothetical protein [Mesorhizobium sp. B1-1-9]TPN48530.1 hypothetical protein FJ976_19210 [Mesorhizobium sp. B1-1-9]